MAPIKGHVFVTLAAGRRSLLLHARRIPVGSIVDTRRGTVRLTSARDDKVATQTGVFGGGAFRVLQARTAPGLTELVLSGASFSSCHGQATAARRPVRPRVLRLLHASAHGSFRTVGRYTAASVRGTAWEIADECDGTRIVDNRGRVIKSIARGVGSSEMSPGENAIDYLKLSGRRLGYYIGAAAFTVDRNATFALTLRTTRAVTHAHICVVAPSGRRYCHPLIVSGGKGPIVVGTNACSQEEGPGVYVVRFIVQGRELGGPLSYTFTRPRPRQQTCLSDYLHGLPGADSDGGAVVKG